MDDGLVEEALRGGRVAEEARRGVGGQQALPEPPRRPRTPQLLLRHLLHSHTFDLETRMKPVGTDHRIVFPANNLTAIYPHKQAEPEFKNELLGSFGFTGPLNSTQQTQSGKLSPQGHAHMACGEGGQAAALENLTAAHVCTGRAVPYSF